MCIYIYIYINIHVCTNKDIYRDREKGLYIHIYIYIYIHIYMYVYINKKEIGRELNSICMSITLLSLNFYNDTASHKENKTITNFT